MHRCTKKWRSILTPQGVCDILQVENKNEIVEYSLNLAVGINYTDRLSVIVLLDGMVLEMESFCITLTDNIFKGNHLVLFCIWANLF